MHSTVLVPLFIPLHEFRKTNACFEACSRKHSGDFVAGNRSDHRFIQCLKRRVPAVGKQVVPYAQRADIKFENRGISGVVKVQGHFTDPAADIDAHCTRTTHCGIGQHLDAWEILIPRLIRIVHFGPGIQKTLSKIIVEVDSDLRRERVIT